MLYVNNEELKEGMPQWEKYQKFLDEVLPDLEDTVIFKSSKPIKHNPTGLVEADTLGFTPFEAIVHDEKYGSQHWRYCTAAPSKNLNGKWIYKPLGMEFKRSKVAIKNEQPDFIFFMLELCHKVKDGTIICENKKKEATHIIAKDDKITEVKYMINSKLSPLSPENTGSEDLLRMIAAAWSVSRAHNKRKSLDEIRVELLGLVRQDEKNTGKGLDTFLSEIKSKERVTLRANIQRAIDNKVIAYDKNDFTWKYKPSNHVLATLSARFFDNPSNGLFEYFLRQDDKRVIFYGTLEDKYEAVDPFREPEEVKPVEAEKVAAPEVKKEEPPEVVIPEVKKVVTPEPEKVVQENKPAVTQGEPDGLEDMKYNDLQKLGIRFEIEVFGKKKVDLIAAIREKRAEKKLQEA